MSYWPEEIKSMEILSPDQILQEAAIELQDRVQKLFVDIKHSTYEDRKTLSFFIENRLSKRSANLFEVSHLRTSPYPVLISPLHNDLPAFLQRKRLVRGTPGLMSGTGGFNIPHEIFSGTPDKYVENEWICGSPQELKEKLVKLLRADAVKSVIFNVMQDVPEDATPVLAQNGQ